MQVTGTADFFFIALSHWCPGAHRVSLTVPDASKPEKVILGTQMS